MKSRFSARKLWSTSRFNRIVWAAYLCLIVLIGSSQFGLNLQGQTQSNINYQIHPRNQSDIELSLLVQPPTGERSGGTSISINNIRYRPQTELDIKPDEICIERIRLLEDMFLGSKDGGGFFLFDGNFPKCYMIAPGVETSTSVIGLYDKDTYEFIGLKESDANETGSSIYAALGAGTSVTQRNSFIYPYDSFAFEFALLMTYRLRASGVTLKEEITVPKVLYLSTRDTTDWNIRISDGIRGFTLGGPSSLIGLQDWEEAQEIRAIKLELSRPLIYQFAYPVVIISLLALIVVLSQVHEFGDFVQGATAVLFGLFGLKTFLLPPTLDVRTMLDPIILSLLVALGISLGLFLFNKRFDNDEFTNTLHPTTPKTGDSSNMNTAPPESFNKLKKRKNAKRIKRRNSKQ